MKQATVYGRKGRLYVGSQALTSYMWVEAGPWCSLDENSPTVLKGQAAKDALSNSGRIIPHPADSKGWKGLIAPLLETAGVGSYAGLMKGGSVCVILESEDGILRLIPY